jgi:hypothetical protein
MKYLCIFIFIFSFAVMSGASKEIDPKMVKYKLTQEELNNIAINYYKFLFEEEHEFKGIRVDSSKSVIMNIIPLKDGDITLSYIVNYNPYGHVFISGYKCLHGPTQCNGGDTYPLGIKEGYLSVDNKDFKNPVLIDYYQRLLRALKNGKYLAGKGQEKEWQKFIQSPSKFNDKFNFDNQYPQPDWWIKKKEKLKKLNNSTD